MLKKRLLIQVVVLACLFAFSAVAQTAPCAYTLASLQGSYAVVGIYGANVAIAFAVRSFDGNGNLTGNYIVNEPTPGSTTGERTILTGTQVGTYTVNCDGTGVVTRIATRSDGTKSTSIDDFMITGATRILNGSGFVMVATSVVDANRNINPIVPNSLLTRTYTRLPN
jgi:hypothetical protein